MMASPAPSAVAGSGSAVMWLMLSALAQRVATFAMNLALMRSANVSTRILSHALIEMDLMLATLLFVSREGIRLTATKLCTALADKERTSGIPREIVALSWLPIPIGACLSLVCAYLFVPSLASVHSGTSSMEERHSAMLFVAAALLELLSEPFYIACASKLLFAPRARIEMTAALIRTVTAFLLIVVGGYGSTGFALAQLAVACVYLLGYAATAQAYIHGGVSSLLPFTSSGTISASTWRMAAAFSAQSLLKHVLTEGDRILLTAFADTDSRGMYAIVSNYGSLAARLVFQPIEESLRTTVSAARMEDKDDFTRSYALFQSRTLVVTLIGSTAAVFGYMFAPVVVRVALGPRWTSTLLPDALGLYAVYLLFMAVNGVTEAFATAAADTRRVAWSSVHMLLAFAVYAAVMAAVVPLAGIRGLILGNMANMAVRICSSVWYIASRVRASGWRQPAASQALPRVAVVAALAAVGGIAALQKGACDATLARHSSDALLTSLLSPSCRMHIATGAVGAVAVAAIIVFQHPALLAIMRRRGKME